MAAHDLPQGCAMDYEGFRRSHSGFFLAREELPANKNGEIPHKNRHFGWVDRDFPGIAGF